MVNFRRNGKSLPIFVIKETGKSQRNHSIEQDLKSSYAFLVNKFLNSNHFNRSVTIYIVSITFTIACTLESFKLLQHKWYSNSRAIHTHIYMHINHEYSTFSITMTINWRLCLLDRMVVLAVPMRYALFIWSISHLEGYHTCTTRLLLLLFGYFHLSPIFFLSSINLYKDEKWVIEMLTCK